MGIEISETMELPRPTYETLLLTFEEDGVVTVSLNRPKKRNALNQQTFVDLIDCFDYLCASGDCRVVVFTGGECDMFSSGIDLALLSVVAGNPDGRDPGRQAIFMDRAIKTMQEGCTALSKCSKPVIGVAHKVCIGAGLELFSACDMRFVTSDCVMSIREPRMGLAADLGALQRMPQKCAKNSHLITELCYTGRDFNGHFAAHELGFCADYADYGAAKEHAYGVAREIAALSPVAIQATKKTLMYSRHHSEDEGLEYVRNINGALLQAEDPMVALSAQMSKTKPVFSKL